MVSIKKKSPSEKIRLVITDMDGTLLTPEKTISPQSLQMMRELARRNVRVCLVSSRPPGGIEMYFSKLPIHNAYGALNGGTLFSPDGKVLSSLTLKTSVSQKAIKMLQEYHLQTWLFRKHDWLVQHKDDPLVLEECDELQMRPTIFTDFHQQTHELAKISGCSFNSDALAKANIALQQELKDVASVSPSHHTLLDVTPLHANKGYALSHLAEYYDVDISQVAAIGDMNNDIPMLEIAGLSIAMGQSKEDVQENAHFVTLSNGQNGWSHAMETYVLPRT